MKSSSDLHQLVQSLDPAEKRFIRMRMRQVKSDAERGYFALYDVLLEMPEFDPEKVKAAMHGRIFANQLPVAKHFLQTRILELLRDYRKGSSLQIYFREQLDYVEILFRRGMYTLCDKYLRKTKKKARKYDQLMALLELVEWEKRLAKWTSAARLEAKLKALNAEEQEIVENIRDESALRSIHDRLFPIATSFQQHPSAGTEALVAELMGSPAVRNARGSTFEARVIHGAIYARYHFFRRDFEAVNRAYEEIVETWLTASEFIAWEPERYLKTLFTYLDSCFRLNRFHRFPEILSLIKESPAKTEAQRALKFFLLHHIELRYRIAKGEYAAAFLLTSIIERGMAKYRNPGQAGRRLTMFYNLMATCFAVAQWSECLKWINRILDFREGNLPAGIHRHAKTLELIVHFELQNTRLVESLARSVLRTATTESPATTGPATLARLLTCQMQEADAGRRTEQWQTYLHTLSRVSEDEKSPLGFAEVFAWARWKVEGGKISDWL